MFRSRGRCSDPHRSKKTLQHSAVSCNTAGMENADDLRKRPSREDETSAARMLRKELEREERERLQRCADEAAARNAVAIMHLPYQVSERYERN